MRLFGKQIDAHAGAIIEEIRLGVIEFDPSYKLAVSHPRPGKSPGAQEITLGHRNFRQPAIGGRIAALNREVAGRLLLDVDIDDDAIGRRAWLIGDLDVLEEVQIFYAPLGAINQRPV